MKNRKKHGIFGFIIMGAALIALAGILASSAGPKYSYAATVDAVSSATTIATPSLSVTSVGYESLKLNWTSVSNATRYEIYRATSATGTFAKVTSASGTSYTNTGRVTGKYYYYKVRAVVVSGSSTYRGSFCAVKGAKAIPGTPTITVTGPTATSAKVSWNGVAGATKYNIYRATSATGTFTFLHSSASTTRSWTNTGLTTGKTYYYKVRVYHLEGTTYVFGKYSSIHSIKR
jgi:fibronectin type 3 domain-containing protein